MEATRPPVTVFDMCEGIGVNGIRVLKGVVV
jgi:hypothetical protein